MKTPLYFELQNASSSASPKYQVYILGSAANCTLYPLFFSKREESSSLCAEHMAVDTLGLPPLRLQPSPEHAKFPCSYDW
jgi:hypothetical protein